MVASLCVWLSVFWVQWAGLAFPGPTHLPFIMEWQIVLTQAPRL